MHCLQGTAVDLLASAHQIAGKAAGASGFAEGAEGIQRLCNLLARLDAVQQAIAHRATGHQATVHQAIVNQAQHYQVV